MKTKILGGAGLHASETRAVRSMEDRLRKTWVAYASLLVADDQGSMDIDTLIITHDRLLLVELKEWSGHLTNSDGKWLINGKSRGKSPYEIKRVHALRLGKLLERELSHRLGYSPAVEAHVVLCGSATPEHLTSSEKRYVHSLEEFLEVATKTGYDQIVSNKGTNLDELFEKRGKPRPNSEKCLAIFQDFLAGTRVSPQKLKHHNYAVSDNNPWFKHRAELYNEYQAKHQERVNEVALLRRWDFSRLGIEHATREQWANIALRETRVIGHLKQIDSGLQEYMLRPLIPLGEDDVQEDFIELYELKRTYQRLDEKINSTGASASAEERLDWTRALLAPFASLHSIGIGHRDVGLHNLWFAKEQKSVVISGLAAAFFPERGTLVGVRRLLQATRVSAPEDLLAHEGEIIDSFRLDVFLLGVVSYSVLFGAEPLPFDAEGLVCWRAPTSDPFDGKLCEWLQRALALEPNSRYATAGEMLNALNTLTQRPTQSADDEGVLSKILMEPFLKSTWSSFTLWAKFQPLPGEAPAAGSKMCYRFQGNETAGLCKFWPNVRPDQSTPGLNRRLDRYRRKLEKVAAGSLPTPKLVDFGLLPGGGLFVASEYAAGTEWSRYVATELAQQDVLKLALGLVTSVLSCHENDISHGDLHPENILVAPRAVETEVSGQDELPDVLLIDMVDFGGEEDAHNVEYGPPNPSVTDAFGRDRFAVYRLVGGLINDLKLRLVRGTSGQGSLNQERSKKLTQLDSIQSETQTLTTTANYIPASLEPLREALIEALLPGEQTGRVEAESPLVVAGSGNAFPYTRRRIEQDNGCYYFNCKHDPNNKSLISCYFTGKAETVTVQVDPEKREITRVSVRTGSFADLVSAFRDQQARISRLIEVQAKSYSGVGDRELIEFIFSLEPLIDLLEKKYAPTFDPSADVAPGIPRRDVTTREVWAALRDTEVDTLQSLEVSSGEIEESRAGFLLVPYVTDSGRPLDFTSQDRVFVTIEADEKNHSAELELSETTKDKVALKAIRRGFRSALHPGVVLRLESQASKSSRDVRTKAVNRVLDGKSVIPDITSFFDREASKGMQVRLATTPSEDLLRSQYDSAEKRLNEKQVVAFQKLAAMGPVGVLQGPPGTGKTAFISKFIHFLFHNQEVTNVLLVGQSHTSVDNVAALTRQLFIEQDLELAVVRIGQERMIATEMLDSHSKALQRQIRHGFHREFEHRVKALTPPLGLPASFVDATISAYRDLAPLLASLASAERARKFALAPVAVEDEEGLEELPQTNGDERTDVDERVAELETQLQTIARRIDSDMPLSGLCAENAWQRVMNALIVRHGISNPAASSRFSAVLSLSQEWLNILGTGEANYDQFLVKTRQLVCGTLVGMGNRQVGLSETLFDWVIVDEAARAQAGELMVAIQTGKRVLLVGDHRQLPPHYNRGHLEKAAKLLRVEKSIVEKTDFQRAFESTGGLALDTQYRMCRPICDLVSECFYREDVGLLNTGRDETPEWYSRLPTPLNASVVWIESGGNDPKGNEKDPTNTAQYVNLAEAEITLSVLRILAHEEFAARLRESITGSDKYAIGIITMYRAQKDLLELRLSKAEWAIPIRDLVKIDTVDSYQGKENKVVILSLVRDNEKGKQGFLHEDPRVNVSVSRAEERLIIIGASKMWTKWNRTFALGSVYKFIDDKVEAGNGNYRIAEGRDIVGAAHG